MMSAYADIMPSFDAKTFCFPEFQIAQTNFAPQKHFL